MNRSIPRSLASCATFLLALCATTTALAGQANTSGVRDGQDYDRFIVRFAPATARGDAAARQQALDAAGHAHGVHFAQGRRLAVGSDVVSIDRKLGATATRALMQRLALDARVEFVEVDGLVRTFMVPNDLKFGDQWHLQDAVGGIRMPVAWDYSRGNGVVVAVLDTGITVHSDLAANVLPGYDFVTDVGNAGDGNARDADPTDPGAWCAGQIRWHGTHVAGTVAAVMNNAIGVAGIAPEAKVVPVRTIGYCGGAAADLADAIVWAGGGSVAGVPANANPADVINISLGVDGACPGSAVQAAINQVRNAGVVVVVASGNDGRDASLVTPAGCAGVITVAGSDKADAPGWSNWGNAVDLSAPFGDGILKIVSTYGIDTYQGLSGTSIAAPQVSGVVALMQAYQPSTPDQVEAVLKATAKYFTGPCPQGSGTPCGGAGVLDATAALTRLATPTLTFANVATAEGNAGNHALAITASLSRSASWPVTFKVASHARTASEGVDYVPLPTTTITIPAGQVAKTINVNVIGDTTLENDETFDLQVTSVAGALFPGTVPVATISNDDPPVMSIADVAVTEGNSGKKSATFTFTLSQPTTTNVTFNVATTAGTATAGSDFVAVAATPVTIAAGQVSKTFAVAVVGDTTIEANEAFTLDVSALAGATATDLQGQATITNDDLPAISITDGSVVEGAAGTGALMNFKITLSQKPLSTVRYTISSSAGTATTDTDFNTVYPLALTFAAGQSSRVFTVEVYGDATIEPNETLFLNLTNVTGATVADGQGLGTIINDD